MKNFYVCYDKNLDALEICNNKTINIVKRMTGNYGVEFGFDINDNLISILIPEPDILFGIKPKLLNSFDCNYLT